MESISFPAVLEERKEPARKSPEAYRLTREDKELIQLVKDITGPFFLVSNLKGWCIIPIAGWSEATGLQTREKFHALFGKEQWARLIQIVNLVYWEKFSSSQPLAVQEIRDSLKAGLTEKLDCPLQIKGQVFSNLFVYPLCTDKKERLDFSHLKRKGDHLTCISYRDENDPSCVVRMWNTENGHSYPPLAYKIAKFNPEQAVREGVIRHDVGIGDLSLLDAETYLILKKAIKTSLRKGVPETEMTVSVGDWRAPSSLFSKEQLIQKGGTAEHVFKDTRFVQAVSAPYLAYGSGTIFYLWRAKEWSIEVRVDHPLTLLQFGPENKDLYVGDIQGNLISFTWQKGVAEKQIWKGKGCALDRLVLGPLHGCASFKNGVVHFWDYKRQDIKCFEAGPGETVAGLAFFEDCLALEKIKVINKETEEEECVRQIEIIDLAAAKIVATHKLDFKIKVYCLWNTLFLWVNGEQVQMVEPKTGKVLNGFNVPKHEGIYVLGEYKFLVYGQKESWIYDLTGLTKEVLAFREEL